MPSSLEAGAGAWLDGGPLLLAFADSEHILRWELAEDILLSLAADDSL